MVNLDAAIEKINRLYKPIKPIKRTAKYVTVKLTTEQFEFLDGKIKSWHASREYSAWFHANFEKKYWTDEYDSTHYQWVNKKTGEPAQTGQIPFLA